MKLYIVSDLHNEFETFEPTKLEYDVAILAGDIHVGVAGIEWIKNKLANRQVIYVPGNHEYYNHTIPNLTNILRAATKNTNINLLDNSSVKIGDIVFLGCTLWTDMRLFNNPTIAGFQVERCMADFEAIRIHPPYRKLRWTDYAKFNLDSVKWLKQQFKQHKNEKIVVVTHHAPSIKSVHEKYINDVVSAAFASNIDELVAESEAIYWIHGHMHNVFSYNIEKTLVICNPKGYPNENPQFNSDLILEM